MPRDSHEITSLLVACRRSDKSAFDELMSIVYNDLRRIAHRQLRRARPGETLSTTCVVHEAYVKLVDGSQVAWEDRAHFLSIAARAMRQIIVDYARMRSTQKRGGNRKHVRLDQTQLAITDQAERLVELDQALVRLSAIDERLTRVVECRFFAGLTERETAKALELSLRTVQRSWTRARAWLKKDLQCPAA